MAGETYKTDRKEEFRYMDRSGNVQTMWRIYAYSAKGTYFHIEVKDTDLDTAPKLLEAKAKQIDSI